MRVEAASSSSAARPRLAPQQPGRSQAQLLQGQHEEAADLNLPSAQSGIKNKAEVLAQLPLTEKKNSILKKIAIITSLVNF